MLATLQAEQAEVARLSEEGEKQERERRELERQRRELERDRERAEQERKELEEQRRRARKEAERMTSAEEERRRQKELLLARMKAIDEGTINKSDVAAGPSSQPMNGPVSSKRPVAADDDVNAVFGEYRPSFLAGTSSSAKTNNTSTTSKRRDPASRPRNNLLVFDDDLSQPSGAEKPSSPDLSFLSSQPSQGDGHSKHLLPRRPRQQATTMNGSVVSDLSDDIEEVIL